MNSPVQQMKHQPIRVAALAVRKRFDMINPGDNTHFEPLRFAASDQQATQKLGNAIASCLRPGMVVGLSGTLGAGKTQLVKYVAEALGVPAHSVVSPTFSLIQSYASDELPLIHMDLYRVADEDELFELGVGELLESDAAILIEWADRFADSLPEIMIWIQIELAQDSRQFLISPANSATQAESFLKCLRSHIMTR